MSLGDTRRRLAAEQATLVRVLTGTDPAQPGFDPARLQAAAASLARKRLQAVKRAWPVLSNALGESLASLFAAYAAGHPLPRHGGPLADGWAFARTLAR